jgi:integrase/recombinase XerD
MQIRIENSKGKKDRYSILSAKTLEVLREYFKTYKPKHYLFEGQGEKEPYSARSIQSFFKVS